VRDHPNAVECRTRGTAWCHARGGVGVTHHQITIHAGNDFDTRQKRDKIGHVTLFRSALLLPERHLWETHAAATARERASLARPRSGLAPSRAQHVSPRARVFPRPFRASGGDREFHPRDARDGRDHGRPRVRLRSHRHRRRVRRLGTSVSPETPVGWIPGGHELLQMAFGSPSSLISKNTRVRDRSEIGIAHVASLIPSHPDPSSPPPNRLLPRKPRNSARRLLALISSSPPPRVPRGASAGPVSTWGAFPKSTERPKRYPKSNACLPKPTALTLFVATRTRLMHQAGILGESFSDAAAFGWGVTSTGHDWEKMVTAIGDHIGSLNFGYRTALRDNNVTYVFFVFSQIHTHRLLIVRP